MAIVVEDGTGLADAESYCSVADMRTYCGNRGLSLVGADDLRCEQLLRDATDYLLRFAGSWQGVRVGSTQALDWPRDGVYVAGYPIASDALPLMLVQASARLAWKAQAGPLVPDVKGPAVKRVKLDVLEKEYDTATIPGNAAAPIYPDVNALLGPLLVPRAANQSRLRRA
jgi:hypothetical protein